ncbi:GAF and ANTAR domain-containing protein [Arthrobacter oryzae]|nr:GAF and ANTAR domain-containing protein [Arthrobacter oryzae]
MFPVEPGSLTRMGLWGGAGMASEELWLHGAVADELQDLVLESADVEDFLRELSRFAADTLSRPGRPVVCGVTVTRRKKPAATAASDPEAFAMDEIQNAAGDGPCLAAMRDLKTVYVRDLARDRQWTTFSEAAARRGYLSILGVPVELEDQTRAALNLYAEDASAFSPDDILQAESFARQASKALRLALRIGGLHDARDDLIAAMASRTVIDMAIGAIMAQSRCSPEKAFALLKDASNTRNTKLRDVARSVIESIGGTADMPTRFDV